MKKVITFWLFILFFSGLICANEIKSLSDIYSLGKGLVDSDGDGLPDRITLQIIIPNQPNAYELAAAGDIAARANLESLAVDFSLIRNEYELKPGESLQNSILIGGRLTLSRDLVKEGAIPLASSLKDDQGLVSLFTHNSKTGIILTATTPGVLLKTARAFFLRWPYLWEIWGREQGMMYSTVEEDLNLFLKEAGVAFEKITVKAVLYAFPEIKSPHETIQKLKFHLGEIKSLLIEIQFTRPGEMQKASRVLDTLILQHRKGHGTHILSYSGCAQITLQLKEISDTSLITIPRVGYPKRSLTPSYKPVSPLKIKGKEFDLQSPFSVKGFYSDQNKDQILDKLDATVILPQDFTESSITQIASKLVLPTAGGSFPILYIDSETIDRKSLVAPIIVGKENKFIQELVKTGKLEIPPLEKDQGLIKTVPEAFNPSSALAIIGAGIPGLSKTLDYFSLTYPYLKEYGAGNPEIKDVASAVHDFLTGKNGGAEAYFFHELEKMLEKIKEKDFDYFEVEFVLPEKNPGFAAFIQEQLKKALNTDSLDVKTSTQHDPKVLFEDEKEFPWEVDEAFDHVKKHIPFIKNKEGPVRIAIGVSESPAVRQKLKERIRILLAENQIPRFEVDVYSSYKQGFFWLSEKIAPLLAGKNPDRLVIRFQKEEEDFSQLKRFYSEPTRWLQELYPVDEIIAQKTCLSIDQIEFEMKNDKGPVYDVIAYDKRKNQLLRETFSPRIREAYYMKILPEWGRVKLTTGWVNITRGSQNILNTALKSDLERFWEYYQDTIITELYSHILKKTKNYPTFAKQPYFKRLLVEMWFSEPDFRLELDEEIISSLESIHDEIYFDTLDFIRGITGVKLEDEKTEEDTPRYSAPGNVLPLVHASSEGQKGKVKILIEDTRSKIPLMLIKWKEQDRHPHERDFVFPAFNPKSVKVPYLIYDGMEQKIENLAVEVKCKTESEYLNLIEIIHSFRALSEKDGLISGFRFPSLKTLALLLRSDKWTKEELLPVFPRASSAPQISFDAGTAMVPTDRIISPEMILEIMEKLSQSTYIRGYNAGRSYENRKIPVLEVFKPLEKYVSLPRLITWKPTLFLSGRQHANEVSATNYILKLAELLATDESYRSYLNKMNFVFHPMENPDGAALAFELQKETPFHSLHAGRYSSLGIDVGYQVNAAKPLLPEAKVRKKLYDKWLPDIYLNLHGYPSHEWVQQFSNYSPFLFRDFWIPRGWYTYFRSLSLPLYENWKKAGEDLKEIIVKEFKTDEEISRSNQEFYRKYHRWAERWQPHLSYLEITEGLNVYAQRRSPMEARLTPRRRMTYVEETPEVMDETAQGQWMDFLCSQGLTYLLAHMKYLAQAEFDMARIEEEIRDRVSIEFIRGRPGRIAKD